jgi:hypothetical protein
MENKTDAVYFLGIGNCASLQVKKEKTSRLIAGSARRQIK